MLSFTSEFSDMLDDQTVRDWNEKLETDCSSDCTHLRTITCPNGDIKCKECSRYMTTGCSHDNSYTAKNGMLVCNDCGFEIEEMTFEPEWGFYEKFGKMKDPSRCHKSRSTGRTLKKDFDDYDVDVPKSVLKEIECKYQAIVKNKTFRGKGRRAIIATCQHFTYMEFGQVRTTDHFRKMWRLERKSMSKGLRMYYEVFKEARTIAIEPEDLLPWICNRAGIGKEHHRKLNLMTRYLKSTTIGLKRSNPQSIASAIVYFYLLLNPAYKEEIGLTKSKFAEKIELSDITIAKLVKQASAISGCDLPI